jgi:hypothetical protein
VDGKLTEITADMALQLRRARMREVERAETLEDFKAIGRQRGYHPNWANIQFGFKERARERARERLALASGRLDRAMTEPTS